jgi:hypothetical protein
MKAKKVEVTKDELHIIVQSTLNMITSLGKYIDVQIELPEPTTVAEVKLLTTTAVFCAGIKHELKTIIAVATEITDRMEKQE